MSMWKEYQKEKYHRETISSEDGFICYNRYGDNSVYVFALFVTKEARSKGEGKRLEKELIAKEKPSLIYCDIDMDSDGWELALIQIVTQAGYKYDSTRGNLIVLYKEINNET